MPSQPPSASALPCKTETRSANFSRGGSVTRAFGDRKIPHSTAMSTGSAIANAIPPTPYAQ
jgi:hypothetical protein